MDFDFAITSGNRVITSASCMGVTRADAAWAAVNGAHAHECRVEGVEDPAVATIHEAGDRFRVVGESGRTRLYRVLDVGPASRPSC